MRKLLSTFMVLLLCACTTTFSSSAKKEVIITSIMDKSIFLMPVPPSQRTVYVTFSNYTPYVLRIEEKVRDLLSEKKYTLMDTPDNAHFMLQIAIAEITEKEETVVSEGKTLAQRQFHIRTDMQISQRVPESIYLRKEQETSQTRQGLTEISLRQDDYEMTQTLGENGNALHWKVYRVSIQSTAGPTQLLFEEIKRPLEERISSLIAGIF